MVITIPADFSSNLVSGQGDDPQRAVISIQRDDANGYVIGLLSASVQSKLESAIDRAAVGAYFDSVFANLATIKTDINTAATGASQLATGSAAAVTGATDLNNGIATAKDGSSQLVLGLADAKAGSTALVTGLSDAKAGSASLVTGLNTLDTGASELAPAAQDVASGVQQLASTAVPVLNAIGGAIPALGQAGANAEQAAGDAVDIATTQGQNITSAQNAVGALPDSPQKAAVLDALNLVATNNTLLVSATSATNQQVIAVNSAFESLNTAASGDIAGATSDITALAAGAAQVASGANTLSTGISEASSGANTLDSGIAQLSTGATELDTGIGNLQLGAQQLDDGLGVLQTGSTSLLDGVTQIDAGANQLATELTAGAERIPTLAPDEQENSSQVLSSPADVQVHIDNPATFYGRGLAPFFFAIAIWVLGISVFLVLRPISGRALAGRASSWRIAVAGWLPVFGLGALGSMLLLAVVWLGLGLDPVNIGGAIGVILLTAACFTAIAHLLRTWLGVVGSAITLVLLMVQLTSAGGLYPVETLPAPFRAIHTFIPMTYVIDALRITFTGGPTDHLWRDVAVLVGFLVVAVGLAILVVHRRRRFRLRDLHPVLA